MPYKWKKNLDVDESIVVLMNVLDKNSELPAWLIRTIEGSIADSDPELVKYFFDQIKKNVPRALKFFEGQH